MSGFYEAVVDLKTVEVKVHLLLGPNRFLTGIWNQKLKSENRVLFRSMSGFYKAVFDLKTVEVILHLLLGPNRFLNAIWNQKLKYKYM